MGNHNLKRAMRLLLCGVAALCLAATLAEEIAPANGINPGPAPVYSAPDEKLENPDEAVDGEVTLVQEGLGDDNEANDNDDEDEDDEGPGGIDDAPDWSLGKGEQPAGTEKMKGGWNMRIFTAGQQKRLGVNKYGEKSGPGRLGEGGHPDDSSIVAAEDHSDDADKSHKHEESGSQSLDSDDVDTSEDSGTANMPDDDPWPW